MSHDYHSVEGLKQMLIIIYVSCLYTCKLKHFKCNIMKILVVRIF